MQIIYGDLCQADCDAIVNASNGIGFMGGKAGVRRRLAGVAESIHYVSGGQIEKEAKKVCRAHGLFGFAPGNVFVTEAPGLPCRYVIHAVTMRYPGTLSSLRTVKKLLPKILEQARALGVKSLAIPMLGTGTGHVSAKQVTKLYHQVFDPIEDLDIRLYLYKKN